MADLQPPNVHEGAADIDDEPAPAPAAAEDRKAAAALSSLGARGDDDAQTATKSAADQKALGEAISKLEISGKKTADKDEDGKGDKEVEKKKIKVDQADVALLVEELELSKVKATELLKSHEGDAVKAMRAFVKAF